MALYQSDSVGEANSTDMQFRIGGRDMPWQVCPLFDTTCAIQPRAKHNPGAATMATGFFQFPQRHDFKRFPKRTVDAGTPAQSCALATELRSAAGSTASRGIAARGRLTAAI